jgi:hypothetical protein
MSQVHHEKPTQKAPQTVNGKPTKDSDAVIFTGHDGRQHRATIETLSGHIADLTATVDGHMQKFPSVPHSATGGNYTWNHA